MRIYLCDGVSPLGCADSLCALATACLDLAREDGLLTQCPAKPNFWNEMSDHDWEDHPTK